MRTPLLVVPPEAGRSVDRVRIYPTNAEILRNSADFDKKLRLNVGNFGRLGLCSAARAAFSTVSAARGCAAQNVHNSRNGTSTSRVALIAMSAFPPELCRTGGPPPQSSVAKSAYLS